MKYINVYIVVDHDFSNSFTSSTLSKYEMGICLLLFFYMQIFFPDFFLLVYDISVMKDREKGTYLCVDEKRQVAPNRGVCEPVFPLSPIQGALSACHAQEYISLP